MPLTREQILAREDLQRISVPVPEWGDEIFVRMLTGAERELLNDVFVDAAGNKIAAPKNYRARLISLSACDEHGSRLFCDADVAAIAGKSDGAIWRVFEAAQKLNGLGANAVETAVKNSEAAPSGDSSSGGLSSSDAPSENSASA